MFTFTSNDTFDESFLSFSDAMEGLNQSSFYTENNLSSMEHVDSAFDDSLFDVMDDLISPQVRIGLEDFKTCCSPNNGSIASPLEEDQVTFEQIAQLLQQQLPLTPPSTTIADSSVPLFDCSNSSVPLFDCSNSSCSQDCESVNSSATSKTNHSSKFDKSNSAKKIERRGKKAKQSEEKQVKKRVKKAVSEDLLWKHNKFSASASYLEIISNTNEVTLTFEVFQTKRRQNNPLESDKKDIKKFCELSYNVTGLNPSVTNYVSLKGLLNKEAIYGDEKVTKFYTWIRLKGTIEYLFLYCQTGKTDDVHNVISFNNGKISTSSAHLSSYSNKLSSRAQVNGPIHAKY